MDLNSVSQAGVAATFKPTQVVRQEQDPMVGLPIETLSIGLDTSEPGHIKTKDFALKDAVTPNADGSYGDPKDIKSLNAVSTLISAQRTWDIFSSYCDTPPPTWFGKTTQLGVNSDDLPGTPNAFFNPFPILNGGKLVLPGTHFGDVKNAAGKTVYASSSSEVTSHEAGHAMMNRFRPNWFRASSPDVHAFHESGADMIAMLAALKDDAVLTKVAEQTKGILTNPNIASQTGEEFGAAINDYVVAQGGPKDYTGGNYVRTAINPNLKWSDPKNLPDRPEPGNSDKLSTEPHDLSRLWTCSAYEILGEMTKQNMAAGDDAKAALAGAAESMLKIYGKMISNTSPEGDFVFADMAKAMIKADQLTNGGKNVDTINKVMQERQILQPSASLVQEELPKGSYPVEFSFTGKEDVIKDTRLSQLGNFSFGTVLSGERPLGLVDDDHEAKGNVAANIARWDRQGKILYTEPNQDPKTIFPLNGPGGEPFTAMVTWKDGQAVLEKVPVFG